MSKVALAFLAIVAVASAQNVYAPVSFCERYAAALFVNSTAAVGQTALISAVVNRALVGYSQGGSINNVTGILNNKWQIEFFTSPVNYYTNSQAQLALIVKLNSFFQVAFGCRAATPGPVSSTMGTIHASMKINATVWVTFVTELVNTLTSFGVPATTGVTGELTYASALLGQFAGGAAASQAICNQADCPAYTGYAEYTTGTAATVLSFLSSNSDPTVSTVSIPLNGNVHWVLGSTHNVVQTDSLGGAVTAGGFTSGAIGATATYTRAFTTAGTFYFKCIAHASMTGTIVVGATPSPGSASGVSASFAIVAAAIATAILSRRI